MNIFGNRSTALFEMVESKRVSYPPRDTFVAPNL